MSKVPTGWTDERFMEVYDLIHQIVADHSTEDDNLSEIRALLPEIEKADDLLNGILIDRRR